DFLPTRSSQLTSGSADTAADGVLERLPRTRRRVTPTDTVAETTRAS
ncbi:MAG: hypothetical protein QOG57_157, partial [Pseudonocardiales bacterium]|nr:hypothetical protein [Pseudonocardiales bacterium]